MYIVEPVDLGASGRVPDTLNDGRPRPSYIVEGEVSDVLLAASDPAAGRGTQIPDKIAHVARESQQPMSFGSWTIQSKK